MHVTLVSGFDPSGHSPSGTRTHVEALASYLRRIHIPHLVVTAARRWEVEREWCGVPVHKANSTLHFQAALATMLSDVPIPQDSIIHAHRPDDLLPFLMHRIGRRRVCTLHGNPGLSVPGRHNRVLAAIYRLAERSGLRASQKVVAVDATTASDYGRKYPWLRGRLSTIPNGVDTEAFKPMDRTECKREWGFGGKVLLYAGRLEPDKHVLDILHTFLSISQPDAVLAIAGDGTLRARIEEQGRGGSVRILGSVSRSRMPSLINASDGGVLFSDEGLSSFALETLACGVPMIGTLTGDLPKLIRDGDNGFLVRSLAELGVAMRTILRGSVVPERSISEMVREYAWPEVGQRLLSLYREM